MAQLTVRNVDNAIAAALKERAARAGRSAEAEHRKILEEALAPAQNYGFFAEARTRRVKLGPGASSTTDILRADRDRDRVR